jgi:signal transduction protein with GAF and PtsI domain
VSGAADGARAAGGHGDAPVAEVPDAVARAGDAQAGLDAVVRAFAADTGTLHFLGSDGLLHLAALHGTLPPPVLEQVRRIPVGKGMAGACAEQDAPVTWCNLAQDDSGTVRPAARSTGMAGSIVVPVRADGRMAGTLGVANAAERTFTDAETASLLACAASLARFRPAG